MEADGTELLRPGDRVADRYVVVRALATGGMGAVFVATHADLGTEVAIKVLRLANGDGTMGARFLREARAAARLQSEHIARVSDFGVLPSGQPFMVLELLSGRDVEGLLESGALPTESAVDCVLQACEGLAVAHAAGIVHRDIKPSNLFVATRPDGSPLVKVLDFGIAKDAADSRKTTGGMGSPYYMSPEQIRAAADVDARTDVWSLGVTLFEMLSGRLPFEGEVASQVIVGIVNDAPQSLADFRPDLPPELVAVVHQCLEKNPVFRPASVGELAALLLPFASPEGAVHGGRAMRTSGGLSSSGPNGDRISQRGTTPSTAVARSRETLPAVSNTPVPAGPSRKVKWAALVAVPVALVVGIVAFALNGRGGGGAPARAASPPRPPVASAPELRPTAQPTTPLGSVTIASAASTTPSASPPPAPVASARIHLPAKATQPATKPSATAQVDGTEDRY